MKQPNLRKSLYSLVGIEASYNPTKIGTPPAKVLDLTIDTTGTLLVDPEINRSEAIEAIKAATLVVTDDPAWIEIIRQYNPNSLGLHYGKINVKRRSERGEGVTFGILNHTYTHQCNNAWAAEMLSELAQPITPPLFVLGEKPEQLTVDCTEVQTLNEFASKVDILLLPAPKGTFVSPTEVLALMGAGVCVVASNIQSIHPLSIGFGTRLVDNGLDISTWVGTISSLVPSKQVLTTAQERNILFAEATCKKSTDRLAKIKESFKL